MRRCEFIFDWAENTFLHTGHCRVSSSVRDCTCLVRCAFRHRLDTNCFLHTVQYGLSSLWMRRWSTKESFWAKILPHILQVNDLYGLWKLRWCLASWDWSPKFWSHTVQLNGFSPVWMRRCLLVWAFVLNPLPHIVQRNGFSPLWIRRCVSRWLFCAKLLPHVVQPNGFSPEWARRWFLNMLLVERVLPHTEHSNAILSVWRWECLIMVPLFYKRFVTHCTSTGYSVTVNEIHHSL